MGTVAIKQELDSDQDFDGAVVDRLSDRDRDPFADLKGEQTSGSGFDTSTSNEIQEQNLFGNSFSLSYQNVYPIDQLLRSHSPDLGFHCSFPTCSKVFKTKWHLRGHEKYGHSDLIQTISSLHVVSTRSLQSQPQEQHKQNNFGIGSKEFKSQSSSKMHHASHLQGRRPFKCLEPICTASFKMKKDLKEHQRLRHHLQERDRDPFENLTSQIEPEFEIKSTPLLLRNSQYGNGTDVDLRTPAPVVIKEEFPVETKLQKLSEELQSLDFDCKLCSKQLHSEAELTVHGHSFEIQIFENHDFETISSKVHVF